MLDVRFFSNDRSGEIRSLEFIAHSLLQAKEVYYFNLPYFEDIRVMAFSPNEENKQRFKELTKDVSLEIMKKIKKVAPGEDIKEILSSSYNENDIRKVFTEITLNYLKRKDLPRFPSEHEKVASKKEENPIYKKTSFKKNEDQLELYKLHNLEEAAKYSKEIYNRASETFKTLLAKSPVFLVKYNDQDVVALGAHLNILIGKQEVTREFKDTGKKNILLPYTDKELVPFLNHIDKNCTDSDFKNYMKELKNERDDLFKKQASWGKGREGLDAGVEDNVEPAINQEKVPPSIITELKETEKKLQKLKELVNLMNQNADQNKDKIQELTRDIDFDIDTGTFIRTAPLKTAAEEATFMRTAPDNKKCPECGCTEDACIDGCLCIKGKCNCKSCVKS